MTVTTTAHAGLGPQPVSTQDIHGIIALNVADAAERLTITQDGICVRQADAPGTLFVYNALTATWADITMGGSGLSIQGNWNADTNTPTLTSGVGTDGHIYIVSVAGSTNLDGITDWSVGDWALFNGTIWIKVDNSAPVLSVAGKTGAVTLNTDDVTEASNLYYTEVRVSANADVAANTTHRTNTANPHGTDVGNLGSGTLAELNAAITDAALDDSSSPRPPSGAAGGDLSGTYPNPTVNDGADGSAIHDNVAGEIATVALKAATVAADLLLIEDSADSNNKKRTTVGGIPHQALGGAGTNTHAQIDTHISDTANPHGTDIGNLGSGTLAELNSAVTDATLDDSSASRPPSGSAGGDLGGTYPNPTVNDGADGSAIHDDTAGEIVAIAAKGTLVGADTILVEDSADSNNKKSSTISAIPHQALSGAGTNTHAQIDTHISDTANPHGTDVGNLGSGTLAELNSAITDATLDDSSASRPPSGSAGGDLGGTYPNPTVNDGADSTAIHDNVAGEIDAIAEKTTLVDDDLVVIEDSAAANAKKKATIKNVRPVFGTGYHYAERTTTLTSTGTLVEYLKLTTGTLEAGTYRIGWMVVGRNSNNGGDWQVIVEVDDTTPLINPAEATNFGMIEEGIDGGGNQRYVRVGWRHIALTAGAHDIDIDLDQIGAGTATLYHGQIEIWRVA